MLNDELFIRLFKDFTGRKPENIELLPKSGSDRIYCRITGNNVSVVGVWNPDIRENDAFTGFANTFRELGLKVPEVYMYIPEERAYLIEDLGDEDLHAWYQRMMTDKKNLPEIEEMYRKVLREMVRFQFDADISVNYELCHPRKVFDRNSMMWDLNYFKYMFLKLSGTGFNEHNLEDDFVYLADTADRVTKSGFLYRDFQSRNIMIKKEDPWFIDFQGGRKGAPHYDAASFLFDPYVELDNELHMGLLHYYYNLASDKLERDFNVFEAEYRIFAVIRLLQALGAYGFRGLYEKKPNFTESIPPAVRQLASIFYHKEICSYVPELKSITDSLVIKWTSHEEK